MRPLGIRATTLVVLVYLGAVLAVLQGFVGIELPITFGASLISHLAGMAAGYGAAIMLILMSRSPWLERDVGAHRLARWHAWAGPLVILLSVLHAVAAVVAWAKARNAITMLARLLRQGDSPPWLRCASRGHYCWAAVERLLATDNS